MKRIVTMLALSLAALGAAHAGNAACDSAVVEKKLAGAAKAAFLKKCEKDAAAAAPVAPTAAASAAPATPAASGTGAAGGNCATQATDKKLAGAAKNSFMKKCQRDAGGDAGAACDAKAAEKKLAGAAKNSFVKKCVSDAAK